MKPHRKTFIVLLLIVLGLISLSCNLPRVLQSSAGQATSIPVSTQAVEDLELEFNSAIATMESGGPFEMTFTETQLTSLAAQRLQEQGDPQVKDVQVFLRDGQIQVQGVVNRNGFDLPLSINVEVYVDSAGGLSARAVSGSVGPFGLPQNLLDQVTSLVNQVIQSQYNAAQVVVESVAISDGKMTIKGRTR